MPKNAQTTAQLHSSHTLVKYCSKFSKPGFSNMWSVNFLMFKLSHSCTHLTASKVMLKISKPSFWTVNFHMFKLDLEKAEEPEIKVLTSVASLKKQESSRKASTSALLTRLKPLTVWITINCGKFWKRWEYQTTWPASWEICLQARKQQLELDMEQHTDSK